MRKSIRNWTNTASDKKESRKGEGNLILNNAMAAKKKKKKAAKKKEEFFTFKNREGVEYIVLFKKPHGKHFDEADGVCYSPEDKRPRIYINYLHTRICSRVFLGRDRKERCVIRKRSQQIPLSRVLLEKN
jgi:hypothetical protein